MATERIIDLAHQRYADREYEGTVPESTAAAEEARENRRHQALLRLRHIAEFADDPSAGLVLLGDVVKNVLILLGEEDR